MISTRYNKKHRFQINFRKKRKKSFDYILNYDNLHVAYKNRIEEWSIDCGNNEIVGENN